MFASYFRKSLQQTSDDSGSVALIFAIAVTAVLGAAGLGVDYARSYSVKSKLQTAADAAALAAASNPFSSQDELGKLARAYLAANHVTGGTASIAIARNGNDVSVSIEMPVPTTFMNILGITSIPTKANSVASQTVGTLEVFSAIDLSGSMGVAADAANRSAFDALQYPYSGRSCMFACHQRDGWEPAGMSSYDMAKAAGIKLREDVLLEAFGTFVDSFLPPTDPAVAANYLRIGVIGFSDNATLLQAPTNDTAAIKLAPAKFPYSSRINTHFADSLKTIKDIVGTQGSGFGNSPNKVLLLITDGVGYDRELYT